MKDGTKLKHPERITKELKLKAKEFCCKDINLPCEISDISKFERNNNISINIFGYEREEIVPLKITKNKKMTMLIFC